MIKYGFYIVPYSDPPRKQIFFLVPPGDVESMQRAMELMLAYVKLTNATEHYD